MAIDYPTKLFEVIGKYVKGLNIFFGFLTQIQTGIDDIEGVLESNTLNRLAGDMHTVFKRFKRDVEGWPTSIAGEVSTILTDRDLVLEELVLTSDDFNAVMQEIISDMIAQADDVEANVCAGVDPAINGKASIFGISGETLDGVTSPKKGFPASEDYIDKLSEIVTAGNVYVECVSAPSDGEETFKWIAEEEETLPYRDQSESPGISGSFPFAHKENLLGVEADFESFTGGRPNGWTVSGGSAVTDYDEYNIAFRGLLGLVIKLIPITIVRTELLTNLEPGRGYYVLIKTSSAKVLAVDFTNTKISGQTDSVKITVGGSRLDLTTWTATRTDTVDDPDGEDWDTAWLYFNVPLDAVPNTTVLTFLFTPYNGADWFIVDEAVVVPARYFNGYSYALTRGEIDEQPEVGDRSVVLATTNNATGVFQEFFRKSFNYQLPSQTDASETIADSLAT